MFTSDIKNILKESGRYAKTALVYGGVTLFCMLFSYIYELCSYGEYSYFMRLLFLVPLLGGMLPFLTMAMAGMEQRFSRLAYNLWNGGVAVIASGFLLRGIIEISGRSTEADTFYWLLGGVMLAAAVIRQVLQPSGREHPARIAAALPQAAAPRRALPSGSTVSSDSAERTAHRFNSRAVRL